MNFSGFLLDSGFFNDFKSGFGGSKDFLLGIGEDEENMLGIGADGGLFEGFRPVLGDWNSRIDELLDDDPLGMELDEEESGCEGLLGFGNERSELWSFGFRLGSVL